MVSKQDLFSRTLAFQNKEFLARDGVHFTGNVGGELLTWPKSFKMKFVEESEKCPNKTAKLEAPEDKNDTERSITMQALFCYFREKIREQGIKTLWPRMSIFQVSPCPAPQGLLFFSSLQLYLMVCFGHRPRLGFSFNSDQGGEQVICLRLLCVQPKACGTWWACHHCSRFSVLPMRLMSDVSHKEH